MESSFGKTFVLLTVARQPMIFTRFPFKHSENQKFFRYAPQQIIYKN